MSQQAEKPAALCVGRLYCDLIFTELPRMPTLGTEVFTDGFGAHAGGGAFITAAHLFQLGHPSALAAMLPASPFGDLMRPDLEASQVDLSLSQPLPADDGPQITVAMVQTTDRAFLTRRSGPAIPTISPEDIRDRKFRHVHIGEAASLVDNRDFVQFVKSQGATISSDCGWDDGFDAGCLKQFQGLIDVFLPNEVEMEALKASGLDESFARLTVIKRGHKGAKLISENKTYSAPAIATQVVDTTGAGDAFNAGFLSAWLANAPLEQCLQAGNERGAIAVGNVGGFSVHPQPSLTFSG